MKYLDRLANVAILIAVAVFLVLVARGDFSRRRVKAPNSSIATVGTTINLPGIHWPAKQDTLLLCISARCHFCRDSLPFYKQLAAQLQGRVNVIAVLPQDPKEADDLLRGADIGGVKVVSQDLWSIGVFATPTLMLVDSSGKLKASWVGELDAEHQKKVIAAVLPAGSVAVPRS